MGRDQTNQQNRIHGLAASVVEAAQDGCYTASMTEKFQLTIRQTAADIIDMGIALGSQMEKWSDTLQRPDGLSATECVGFITKESESGHLNLTLDVQAPSHDTEAKLRIWAIETILEDGEERYHNIQLSFRLDHTEARELVQKGSTFSYQDLHSTLHSPKTKLTQLTLGHHTGFDKTLQQAVGERYDLTGEDLSALSPENSSVLLETLQTVVRALRSAVEHTTE